MAQRSGRAKSESETRLIYGVMPVLESLRADRGRIRKIAVSKARSDAKVSEITDVATRAGIPVVRIPKREIDLCFEREVNHQGVIAFVKTAVFADADELIERALKKEDVLFLVLDGIEDPGNIGAILRTAECTGVDGVFIPEHRNAGITETAVKASAGASELVEIAKVTNQNRLIDKLKSSGIWVVGAAGESDTSYAEWDFDRKTAIVLGSEGKGLHRLTAEKCDILVKIPMLGKIGSLNVSVAAGVLLYEVLRQRN